MAAPFDRTLRAVFVAVALFGLAMAVVAAIAYGLAIGAGVVVGAALALVNFWALARIVPMLFRQKRAGGWAVLEVLKMVALVVVAWLIIRSGLVDGFALAVGYGALPLGITVGGLLVPAGESTEDAGESSAPAPNVVDDGPDAP